MHLLHTEAPEGWEGGGVVDQDSFSCITNKQNHCKAMMDNKIVKGFNGFQGMKSSQRNTYQKPKTFYTGSKQHSKTISKEDKNQTIWKKSNWIHETHPCKLTKNVCLFNCGLNRSSAITSQCFWFYKSATEALILFQITKIHFESKMGFKHTDYEGVSSTTSHRVDLYLCFYFLLTLYCPFWEIWAALPG